MSVQNTLGFNELKPDEQILALLAEKQREKGRRTQIGLGDYVQWKNSYKVQGFIVREEKIGSRAKVPMWVIYNPLVKDYQTVPKSEVRLLGW